MSNTNQIKLSNSEITIAENQFDIIPSCVHPIPLSFVNSNEYSRYMFCCLTTIHQNNLTLYRLPENFIVYLGDIIHENQIIKPKGQMAFNINAEDASRNGFIQQFQFKQPVHVVALDRVSNVKVLMANAINEEKYDVVNALENNYSLKRIDDKKTAIIMNKDPLSDFLILNYLCSLGYSGFASKPLNGQPARIYLCSSEQYLSFGKFSKYNDQFLTHTSQLT